MLALEKIKSLKTALSDLLYPKTCAACSDLIQEASIYHLCATCLKRCALSDLSHRCVNCFDVFDSRADTHSCQKCRKKPSFYHKLAGVFEKDSPLIYILHEYKNGNQTLASLFASLAFLQFEKAGFLTPDYIVPVPSCALMNYERGYKTTLVIANALASLLQCQVFESIVWRGENIRQNEKTMEQRGLLPLNSVHVKKGSVLSDKRILLLDDEYVTGRTLHCTAEALLEHYPRSLEALVLCI